MKERLIGKSGLNGLRKAGSSVHVWLVMALDATTTMGRQSAGLVMGQEKKDTNRRINNAIER